MGKFRAKKTKPQKLPATAPRYCGPHATGQAYSIWPKSTAQSGRHRYHGIFGTPESRENYRRWVAELPLGDGITVSAERPLLTIAEVWEKWCAWALDKRLYEKGGLPTGTFGNYCSAMNRVLQNYSGMLIQQFTPYNLSVCREQMVIAGLARVTVNGYVAKIKRVWRRAAAWGLIDNETFVAIESFEPLRRNEGGNESPRKLSVAEASVVAIKNHVTPAVAAMIDVLTWSGCRTQEVRLMRTCDIIDEDPAIPPSLQGKCWVYRPKRWKSEHLGKSRVILLGPQAMGIIEPWLRPMEPERYLFSPFESIVHRNRKLTKHGRYVGKNKSAPTFDPNRPYASHSLWEAISAACKATGVEHWHPHQLRHLAATRLASRYGVSVAQILLGHANVETTLRYVDPGVLTKDDRDKYAIAIRAIAESG